MLLRLENVGKEFSGQWLFRGISVQCNLDDRIALIGRNGAGKTTLFELIRGRCQADEGTVLRSRRLDLSWLEQIPELDDGASVLESTLVVFEDLHRLEAALAEREKEIAESGLGPEVSQDYEKLRSTFELHGGYDYRSRAEKVLHGLGFEQSQLSLPCGKLSGGQRSRVALARALLRPADLLLLDEPTNHLDLQGILWLGDYLAGCRCALLVISHDRRFLDRVTTRTWEFERSTLFDYPAGYSRSRRMRAERVRLEQQAFERQEEWRRKTEDFIRRNIAGQKTRQAQSRRKQLERAEWLEAPREESTGVKIRIPEAERSGTPVVEMKEVSVGFPGRVLLREVSLTLYRGRRVGILGGNGCGKTTLLRTILGVQPPLGGKVNWGHNYLPGYFAQEGRLRGEGDSAYDFLGRLNPLWTEQELRGFAAVFGFQGECIFKSLEALSGGERSRLSLARLFSKPCNVLCLDEPTNHLDIESREALEAALDDFSGALVVVSHDLYFMDKVVDDLLLIRDGALEAVSDMDELTRVLSSRGSVAQAAGGKEPAPAVRRESTGLSKNERRRLEIRLAEVEARIEALEKHRAQVEEELQSGTADHTYLQQLSCRFSDLDEELSRCYDAWGELGSVLESDEAQ